MTRRTFILGVLTAATLRPQVRAARDARDFAKLQTHAWNYAMSPQRCENFLLQARAVQRIQQIYIDRYMGCP